MIMIESEGLTEDLPPEQWKTDVIKKIVDKFGLKNLMFEAADPPVFKWYLKNFGKDVNLFIDYSQIVEFTAWKTKLWGDPEIWRGKNSEVTHKNKNEERKIKKLGCLQNRHIFLFF